MLSWQYVKFTYPNPALISVLSYRNASLLECLMNVSDWIVQTRTFIFQTLIHRLQILFAFILLIPFHSVMPSVFQIEKQGVNIFKIIFFPMSMRVFYYIYLQNFRFDPYHLFFLSLFAICQ